MGKTSSEAKHRYNSKTYDNLGLQVKKEIAKVYKEKCKAKGIPYSQPLHDAIDEFIKNN